MNKKNISVAGVNVQVVSKREAALVRLTVRAAAGSSCVVCDPSSPYCS